MGFLPFDLGEQLYSKFCPEAMFHTYINITFSNLDRFYIPFFYCITPCYLKNNEDLRLKFRT